MNKYEKTIKTALSILLGVLIALIIIFLYGYIVMTLWNMILPALFGFPLINYWQAVGLRILGTCLFGSIAPDKEVSQQEKKGA